MTERRARRSSWVAAAATTVWGVVMLAAAPGVGRAAQEGKRNPAQRISPADAARIKYTKQRFVYLDIGETASVALKGGAVRVVRLAGVREEKDSVIGLTRRAEVDVEIDGRPLRLVCQPYELPVVRDGVRIQADTTSAWLDMGKRVQLSVWDAADPVVDTTLYAFPLADYRMFAQGSQSYNEPVHLGDRDGDPKGQRFVHNYGFDMAGFEGRDRVVAPIDGTVIAVVPKDGWVGIEDDRGIVMDLGHLDSIRPEIKVGMAIRRGQPVGIVGRKGPSGNYSHLHHGIFLSRADFDADRSSRNVNLYPWVREAYRAASGARLMAVARPHHTARTGEAVLFDGGQSEAFGGKVVSYRWEFSDGSVAEGPAVKKAFDRPGYYAVVLRVEDDRGGRDFDVSQVRVYTAAVPEDVLTTLFFTGWPSAGARAGEAVHFKGWPEGGTTGPIRVDFGDGTAALEDYRPETDVEHVYAKPGAYVVTASAEAAGRPAIAKIKMVVEK